MTDWFDRSNDNRYSQSPQDYSQERSNSRAEIESLRNKYRKKDANCLLCFISITQIRPKSAGKSRNSVILSGI
jgi:hypothetical protein